MRPAITPMITSSRICPGPPSEALAKEGRHASSRSRRARTERERERVAPDAVERRVVKQARAEQERQESGVDDGFGEVTAQEAAQEPEAGDHITEARQAGRVLVVRTEAVGREVAPPRQGVRHGEERRDEDGFADRVRVDPVMGDRPADDGRPRGKLPAAAVVGDGGERRVVMKEPRRQVDVVRKRVGADRGPGAAGRVGVDVARQARDGREEDEPFHRRPEGRRGDDSSFSNSCHRVSGRSGVPPRDSMNVRTRSLP